MTEVPPDMWWPSPLAFEDLIVEDTEHGFELSAPNDTECGEWIAFWNQDEAHHLIFEREFTAILSHYVNEILDANGKDEDLSNGGTKERIQTQDDFPGVQS